MTTITVTNNADSGPGTLRQAISDASSGNNIEFYSDYIITLTSGQIEINKDLLINSLGKQVTISGNNTSRVFVIASGNVKINELSITNGYADHLNLYGGAIRILPQGILTITNSTLYSNSGFGGGAISIGGTLTIINSTISGNNAIGSYCYGGGLNNGGTLTIIDSTISNNNSDFQGGGINNFGIVTITNTTLTNNSAFSGGAIYNTDNGTLTLINSALISNNAYSGGAIYTGYYTTPVTNLINSTLSHNNARSAGGAIWNTATLNISFSTVAENTAQNGDGIYSSGRFAVTNFKNSIVANNGNANYFGSSSASIVVFGVNVSTDDTCTGFTKVTTDQLRLAQLALNSPGTTATHALLAGSAAINTVTDFTDIAGNIVTTDQRGVSRLQNNSSDAGAYEFVAEPIRGIPFF